MLELLPESADACLGFELSGKLIHEERDAMLPKLDIAAHGKIRLLVLYKEGRMRNV
jgi:hypothetical protein